MNKSLIVRKILHKDGPLLVNPAFGHEPSIYDMLVDYYKAADCDESVARMYAGAYIDHICYLVARNV